MLRVSAFGFWGSSGLWAYVGFWSILSVLPGSRGRVQALDIGLSGFRVSGFRGLGFPGLGFWGLGV